MEMGQKKTLPSGAGFALDLPSIAGLACSITLLITGLVLVVFGTHEVTADEITEWRYERAAEEYQSESSDGSAATPLLPDGAVAWLRVNGTSIDYPVAQAHESDPSFYLSHDIWVTHQVQAAPSSIGAARMQGFKNSSMPTGWEQRKDSSPPSPRLGDRKSSTVSAHSNGKRPTAYLPSDPSAPSESIKRIRRYRHLMHAVKQS